jgi:pimeloyl-ACP methyl ester carboxylesterase
MRLLAPLAALVLLVSFATESGAQAPRAAAAPAACTTATPACAEWVPLGSGPMRSMVYRSHALDTRNEAIRRAVVMVHGQGRDADNYFRTTMAAAFLAGAIDTTIVVSLKFTSRDGGCQDAVADHEVSWPCAGNSWRAGGVAVNAPPLTSYDFADTVLRKLARKDVFPNLAAIVLAGHSAGGQFASRYGMANTIHETIGVPIAYVVSNPSSYGYPDGQRPDAELTSFEPYREGRNCTTYDRWPYGLQERAGYAGTLTDEAIRKQLVSRPVVYLMGELDTTPLAGFDASCPAMAQGPNRFERARAFHRYVTTKYGATHTLVPVPLCGHNARCMFTAERALPVLFGTPGATRP